MAGKGHVSLTKAKMLLNMFGQEHAALAANARDEAQVGRLGVLKRSVAELCEAIERKELSTRIDSGWWDKWFVEESE